MKGGLPFLFILLIKVSLLYFLFSFVFPIFILPIIFIGRRYISLKLEFSISIFKGSFGLVLTSPFGLVIKGVNKGLRRLS